jgi:hypothetical protein
VRTSDEAAKNIDLSILPRRDHLAKKPFYRDCVTSLEVPKSNVIQKPLIIDVDLYMIKF